MDVRKCNSMSLLLNLNAWWNDAKTFVFRVFRFRFNLSIVVASPLFLWAADTFQCVDSITGNFVIGKSQKVASVEDEQRKLGKLAELHSNSSRITEIIQFNRFEQLIFHFSGVMLKEWCIYGSLAIREYQIWNKVCSFEFSILVKHVSTFLFLVAYSKILLK